MPAIERRASAIAPSEERRFRYLVETFALAVWETDHSGEPLSCSSTWPGLTGQTEEAMARQGWLDAVHPDDREGVAEAWRKSLVEERIFQREYRIQHCGQGWIWTLAHAAPIRDECGKVLKWLGMNVDVSARRRAEEALKEADRQKNEFISVLAHELRNPLAPLRSSVDLLLNETSTSASKARAVAMMNRQTSHMARLVDDLIDASRITTGKLQVYPEKVRLSTVLKSSVDNIRPALDAKHQRVFIHGIGEVDPMLHADPVRLNQAFVNLLNNSAKFSPEQSKIDIAVRRLEDEVSVTVRDTGRAIPESDLPNVFKLFVQSARHDAGDGLGIGMALASDVVRLHGGSIEARSVPGGAGAEFEVLLPVADFNAPELGDDGSPPSSDVPRSLRVLVVDDNVDAAEALGALLEISGYTLRIAQNGADAVQETLSFMPEVIFMDIGMPVMGGVEATRRIRAATLSVRPFIIALTGWDSEADRSSTKEAGVDMHLAKPAEIDVVLEAIESAVRRP